MDEPLSNLDAKLRVQMRAEIARLQNRLGTTTVYVTHDQTEAMTLGDRVVVMLAGVAQQIGTPEELYNSPANLFVAGFIGSPAMNFFPATLTDVGVRLPFGEVTLTQEVHDLLARHPRPRQRHRRHPARTSRGRGADRRLCADPGADLRGRRSTSSSRWAPTSTCTSPPRARARSPRSWPSWPPSPGAGENEFVARVSTESKATPGQTLELAFDTSKLTIFDADTGANLIASAPPAPTASRPEACRADAVGTERAATRCERRRSHRHRPPSDRRPGRGPRAPARALRRAGIAAEPAAPA